MGTSRYRGSVILHIYFYHQLAHRSSGKCLTRPSPNLLYRVGKQSMGSAVIEASPANNILSSLPISTKILYCNQIHLQQRIKKRKKKPTHKLQNNISPKNQLYHSQFVNLSKSIICGLKWFV